MSFTVGQTVVHPNHGAAVIERTEDRELAGEMREYLVFTVAEQDLVLKVPVEACEDVGIRAPVDADAVDGLIESLRGETKLTKGTWARKFKARQRAVQSGDPAKIADVVRDLHVKYDEKGRLSAAEKRLQNKARAMLIGELAAALAIDYEAAEAKVDEALEDATVA